MYRVRENFAGFIFADESKSAKSAKICRLENLALSGSWCPQWNVVTAGSVLKKLVLAGSLPLTINAFKGIHDTFYAAVSDYVCMCYVSFFWHVVTFGG